MAGDASLGNLQEINQLRYVPLPFQQEIQDLKAGRVTEATEEFCCELELLYLLSGKNMHQWSHRRLLLEKNTYIRIL